MTIFSAWARCACSLAPTRPSSSPTKQMKTSVASNSIPLWPNTRASSIVSAVPLPSSSTPGAGLSVWIQSKPPALLGLPVGAPAGTGRATES